MPKSEPDGLVEFGSPRNGVLVALYASVRNSTRYRSRTLKTLLIARSSCGAAWLRSRLKRAGNCARTTLCLNWGAIDLRLGVSSGWARTYNPSVNGRINSNTIFGFDEGLKA